MSLFYLVQVKFKGNLKGEYMSGYEFNQLIPQGQVGATNVLTHGLKIADANTPQGTIIECCISNQYNSHSQYPSEFILIKGVTENQWEIRTYNPITQVMQGYHFSNISPRIVVATNGDVIIYDTANSSSDMLGIKGNLIYPTIVNNIQLPAEKLFSFTATSTYIDSTKIREHIVSGYNTAGVMQGYSGAIACINTGAYILHGIAGTSGGNKTNFNYNFNFNNGSTTTVSASWGSLSIGNTGIVTININAGSPSNGPNLVTWCLERNY